MRIGLHLPSAQPGATAEGILAVARGAEHLGFDGVWAFDHLMTPTTLRSAYPYSRDGAYPLGPDAPIFDPLALFGVIAGATSRIAIGTGVLVAPYRHPIVLGKALASIAAFASGRLVLGLGAGWMQEEFAAVGVPFEDRGARLDEYLDALRAVWAGAPARFDGRCYRWEEASFLPAPPEPIPLVVGGHSDAALRRAATRGDGWAIVTGRGQGAGLEAVEARLAALRTFRDEAGRGALPFELLFQSALALDAAPNARLPLFGPPEVVAGSLLRLRELGVTWVDLVVPGDAVRILESAARFAEEVRPLLG